MPTPCSPPEILYALLSNFPPAWSSVSATSAAVLFLESPVAGNLPLASVSTAVVAVGLAAVVYLVVCHLLGYRQMGAANIRRRADSVS